MVSSVTRASTVRQQVIWTQAEFSRASAVQQTLKASVTVPASHCVFLLSSYWASQHSRWSECPLLQTLQWLSAPLHKRPHSSYSLWLPTCLSHQTLLASSPSAVPSAPSASAVASLLCHEHSRSQDLSYCPSAFSTPSPDIPRPLLKCHLPNKAFSDHLVFIIGDTPCIPLSLCPLSQQHLSTFWCVSYLLFSWPFPPTAV